MSVQQLDDLYEAVGILRKHAQRLIDKSHAYVQPEHDELYIGSMAENHMQESDAIRLSELGWVDEESNGVWRRRY